MSHKYMQAIEVFEAEGERIRKKYLDKAGVGATLSLKDAEERDNELAGIQWAIDVLDKACKEDRMKKD